MPAPPRCRLTQVRQLLPHLTDSFFALCVLFSCVAFPPNAPPAQRVWRFTSFQFKGEHKKRKERKREITSLSLSFAWLRLPGAHPIHSPPSALCFSPIPHPLRGAREHAVEKTEPIKTLPESILSVLLKQPLRGRKGAAASLGEWNKEVGECLEVGSEVHFLNPLLRSMVGDDKMQACASAEMDGFDLERWVGVEVKGVDGGQK